MGLVVVVIGLSCPVALGIFPGQGLNLCPLNWQADSYPLHHQGSPWYTPVLSTLKMEKGRLFAQSLTAG